MSAVVLSKPTRCKRCNRILTDPESIKRGYGPECIETINLEVDLTEQARMNGDPGFMCDHCERVTPIPLMRKGRCPICRYGITRLEDLDGEPFAEGAG